MKTILFLLIILITTSCSNNIKNPNEIAITQKQENTYVNSNNNTQNQETGNQETGNQETISISKEFIKNYYNIDVNKTAHENAALLTSKPAPDNVSKLSYKYDDSRRELELILKLDSGEIVNIKYDNLKENKYEANVLYKEYTNFKFDVDALIDKSLDMGRRITLEDIGNDFSSYQKYFKDSSIILGNDQEVKLNEASDYYQIEARVNDKKNGIKFDYYSINYSGTEEIPMINHIHQGSFNSVIEPFSDDDILIHLANNEKAVRNRYDEERDSAAFASYYDHRFNKDDVPFAAFFNNEAVNEYSKVFFGGDDSLHLKIKGVGADDINGNLHISYYATREDNDKQIAIGNFTVTGFEKVNETYLKKLFSIMLTDKGLANAKEKLNKAESNYTKAVYSTQFPVFRDGKAKNGQTNWNATINDERIEDAEYPFKNEIAIKSIYVTPISESVNITADYKEYSLNTRVQFEIQSSSNPDADSSDIITYEHSAKTYVHIDRD